jgi:hypothetical protein
MVKSRLDFFFFLLWRFVRNLDVTWCVGEEEHLSLSRLSRLSSLGIHVVGKGDKCGAKALYRVSCLWCRQGLSALFSPLYAFSNML